MLKRRRKTGLPEPQPGSDRRRRFSSIRGARPRRDRAVMIPALHPRASDPITLERRLGRPGIVEVWSAKLEGRGPCVVKFPSARWSGHAGAVRLVERESEYLHRAAHAGVVEAIDVVSMRTGPGLVLEFLAGGDLVALAGSHPQHWAGLVRDVVRALAHVHSLGIVHGDVKPRNVLLDAGGRAKLIDFGLAQDVGSERRAGGGTPAYQRAAQYRGVGARAADDVYALAVMIYELWCGRLPFGLDPDARALEKPPVSPLLTCPAHADEPMLVDLGAFIERALTPAAAGRERPLDALDTLLTAIMTAYD